MPFYYLLDQIKYVCKGRCQKNPAGVYIIFWWGGGGGGALYIIFTYFGEVKMKVHKFH